MTDDNRFWTCWREATAFDYEMAKTAIYQDRIDTYSWAFCGWPRANHQASRAVHQPHR